MVEIREINMLFGFIKSQRHNFLSKKNSTEAAKEKLQTC